MLAFESTAPFGEAQIEMADRNTRYGNERLDEHRKFIKKYGRYFGVKRLDGMSNLGFILEACTAASHDILDLRRCYCNGRAPECRETQQRGYR